MTTHKHHVRILSGVELGQDGKWRCTVQVVYAHHTDIYWGTDTYADKAAALHYLRHSLVPAVDRVARWFAERQQSARIIRRYLDAN